MTDMQLVLAIFPDEAAADAAVESLMAWEKKNDVVSRPVGVLVVDDRGKIKEHKLGKRSGAKGAGIGLGVGQRAGAWGNVAFSGLGQAVGAGAVHDGLLSEISHASGR